MQTKINQLLTDIDTAIQDVLGSDIAISYGLDSDILDGQPENGEAVYIYIDQDIQETDSNVYSSEYEIPMIISYYITTTENYISGTKTALLARMTALDKIKNIIKTFFENDQSGVNESDVSLSEDDIEYTVNYVSNTNTICASCEISFLVEN